MDTLLPQMSVGPIGVNIYIYSKLVGVLDKIHTASINISPIKTIDQLSSRFIITHNLHTQVGVF